MLHDLLPRALTRICAALFVLAFFTLPSRAHAATLTVTSSADSGAGSLRATLASARDGDIIVFDASLSGALINLVTPDDRTLGSSPTIPLGPTALVIDGIHVIIDGASAPGLQIDGASTWRVFVVVNGGHLELRNLTVQNGHAAGGGGGVPGGGGGGAGVGGGVFVSDGSALTLDGVTMLQNAAIGGAGGHYRSGAFLPRGAECGGGGGGLGNGDATLGNGADGTDTLSGAGGLPNRGSASIDVGHAGGDGGGGSGGCLIFSSGGQALLEGGGDGGWGGGGGGGASYHGAGFIVRWDLGGAGGFGGGGGGVGLGTGSGGSVVSPSTYATSLWGGGRAGVSYCVNYGCRALNDRDAGGGGGAGLGGAIFVRGGGLVVTRSTFSASQSIGGPGGGFPATPGVGAGAVFVLDGSATITESTFSGNVGGAVYVLGLFSESHLSVGSTILAGSAGPDCGFDRRGGFASLGHNLIEMPGGCVPATSDLSGVDPMLAALGSNGGPTATMLPSSGSAVVGAGTCALATDQRGRARSAAPVCDIGAVELDRAALTVVLAGSGSGSVTSDVLGISCGTACTSMRAPTPVSLTLTAAPSAGSSFVGYTGASCGASATCSVAVSSDTSITATFVLDAGDAGTSSGSDAGSVDAGVEDAGVGDAAMSADASASGDASAGTDASASDDAAMSADASASGDASARDASFRDATGADATSSTLDAGTAPPSAAGCGCRATSQSPRGAAWMLAVLVIVRVRRRRAR